MEFICINEKWGDRVYVTLDDVKEQAKIFGLDPHFVFISHNGEEILFDDGTKKETIASIDLDAA